MGIILATAGIAILLFILMRWSACKDHDITAEALLDLSMLFILIVIGEFFAVGVCYIQKDANIAAYEQRYDSLLYQFDEDIYRYELNGEGKRDLYREIEGWNYDLARSRVYHNSFWTNWFYPIDYDQFEFIEFPKSVG